MKRNRKKMKKYMRIVTLFESKRKKKGATNKKCVKLIVLLLTLQFKV